MTRAVVDMQEVNFAVLIDDKCRQKPTAHAVGFFLPIRIATALFVRHKK